MRTVVNMQSCGESKHSKFNIIRDPCSITHHYFWNNIPNFKVNFVRLVLSMIYIYINMQLPHTLSFILSNTIL